MRPSYLISSFAFLIALSGCQKAKMTHVQPAPEVVNPQVVSAQPLPPQSPAPIPLPPTDRGRNHHHHDEDIEIGPTPMLPPFVPSPATPVDPGGEFDDSVFFENSQSGTRPNTIGPGNTVEWFDKDHVERRLRKCGENCPPEVEKPKPVPVPPKPVTHMCREEVLPAQPITDKIDILFVVDTSASLKDELSKIVSEMGEFIKNLRSGVDYQIAVLPAHGIQGPYSGQIYGEVIKFGGEQGQRGVTFQLVQTMNKLFSDDAAKDKGVALGEAGMLSLYRSVTPEARSGRRTYNQRLGFYREDAALAVVFVSDENDVCYRYKAGEKPNVDSQNNKYENMALEKDCKFTDGQVFKPKHLMDALQILKGEVMPVILTGIVYTSNNIPKTSGKYYKENEMGRGYLDVIEPGGAHNLADKNFGKALAKLGKLSQFRIDFPNRFACHTNVPADQIDLLSMKMTMTSSTGKRLAEFRADCVENPNLCKNGTYPMMAEMNLTRPKVYFRPIIEDFRRLAQPNARIRTTFKTIGH